MIPIIFAFSSLIWMLKNKNKKIQARSWWMIPINLNRVVASISSCHVSCCVLKQVNTASRSWLVAINVANAFFLIQNSTGRVRVSFILHERNRSAFSVLPQGDVNFAVRCPSGVCRDLIETTFHQNINGITQMGLGGNGMARPGCPYKWANLWR